MARALILTYHAVDSGHPPLSIDPALFEKHADAIAASGARSLTVRELAEELRTHELHGTAVVITFDDGFASIAETAAPILLRRGLTATVFCVGARLGGTSDWPSAPDGAPRSRLASAADLAELSRAGFEIGSHGSQHDPLSGASDVLLRREVVTSRVEIEDAVGTEVTSFAYPYGALSDDAGRALVADTYAAACTTLVGHVSTANDPLALPRVDAHYVRRPEALRRAVDAGVGRYLFARGLAARARRTVRKDYVPIRRAAGLSE